MAKQTNIERDDAEFRATILEVYKCERCAGLALEIRQLHRAHDDEVAKLRQENADQRADLHVGLQNMRFLARRILDKADWLKMAIDEAEPTLKNIIKERT
jgi:hypothetical protein